MAEKKKQVKKNTTESSKTKATKTSTKKEIRAEKKSTWVKFRIFLHGVKSEFDKVHWPTRNNMVKYSIATIVFVLFLAGFFYIIDVLFALIQSLFN